MTAHLLGARSLGCVNDAAAVLLGSSISAIVAMIVVGLQHSLERRRQERAERADRLGAFFAASHAVAIGIQTLARASVDDKVAVEANIRATLSDRFNSRLAQLRLLEDCDVVVAAAMIDRELMHQTDMARTVKWDDPEWRDTRNELNRLTDVYESVARRRLGKRSLEKVPSLYVPREDSS